MASRITYSDIDSRLKEINDRLKLPNAAVVRGGDSGWTTIHLRYNEGGGVHSIERGTKRDCYTTIQSYYIYESVAMNYAHYEVSRNGSVTIAGQTYTGENDYTTLRSWVRTVLDV